MTEFETKLLKILEETNVQICNVHNQLHTLDDTLERTIDAISNVGGNVDTGYLSELVTLNSILEKINESIYENDATDSNVNLNLTSLNKNLAEISLDISKIAKYQRAK